MPDNEHSLTLGDLVTLQRGTTYKSALLGQAGPVLLGLASIQRNGGFRNDNLKTYGGDSPEKLTLRPGDIYVSLKDVTQSADLLGAIARVPPHIQAGRVTQDTVKLSFIRRDFPSGFLYWLLRTPAYRAYCRAHAIGTTNLSLSRDDFLAFPVPKPEAKELTLVETLDALDDKIELNRRMNETLEALAQSLFKSWFVDATQSALPKGWRECALGDVIEVKHGFAYQGEFFRDEPCRDILLTPGNFAIGGGFKEDKFKYYEGPTPDEYVLSEGDLLVTMTDLSKAGDTLGYGALLPAPPDNHRFHHNQRLGKVLIHDPKVINKPFLYQVLRSHEYRTEILGGATGTTVKHTSPGRIKSFKFVLPPEPLMQKFGSVAGAWHESAAHNRKESRTLAALRDALLPKLLSGELRVPAATPVQASASTAE